MLIVWQFTTEMIRLYFCNEWIHLEKKVGPNRILSGGCSLNRYDVYPLPCCYETPT